MKNEVDLWSYKGLKESDVPNKRQKIATDADVKGKTLKLAPNQEKLATKQTSLLSFFSLSSTTSSKNETTVSSKIVTSETKVNRKIVSHETKMVDSGNKKCPFYKFIEGKNHLLGTGEHLNITGYTLVDHWLFSTPYVVDAFNYGYVEDVQGYFLSHFHYDHYRGLTKNFSRPIYCGEITANLLKFVLKVSPNFINVLPMNSFVSLPDGTRVLLIDANHCPGSVLFLFHLKNGRRLLHTGDFRADQEKIINLQLWNSLNIDIVYLDTTYCDDRYVFPSQTEIIEKSLDFVSDTLRRCPKLLICVGTYTIGKERIFSAIAKLLDCKIFVQKSKHDILQCLNDEDLKRRLTLNANETRLHVLSMFQFSFDRLNDYLNEFGAGYDSILALKPTGWEFTKNNSKKDNIFKIYRRGDVIIAGVPYSEHSSCEELKNFIQKIRPKKILPTVNNGDAKSRQKMQTLFNSWLNTDTNKSEQCLRQYMSKCV